MLTKRVYRERNRAKEITTQITNTRDSVFVQDRTTELYQSISDAFRTFQPTSGKPIRRAANAFYLKGRKLMLVGGTVNRGARSKASD